MKRKVCRLNGKKTKADVVFQGSVVRDQIRELGNNVSNFLRALEIVDNKNFDYLYRSLELVARDLRMQNLILNEGHSQLMIEYNRVDIYNKIKNEIGDKGDE